jgi:hypothetical protein
VQQDSAFATLRRFAGQRAPVERCDLCGAVVPGDHRHLLEPATRQLRCACDPCALLFTTEGGRFKRVPQRIRGVSGFRMTDAQWDALRIPIALAFFFESSVQQRIVALYPSPAGPTESLLPLDTWRDIVDENPVLRELEPDVEALLVDRVDRERGSFTRCYLLPIDECFRLVGLLRMHWKGFAGGDAVWSELGRFFEDLNRKGTVVETGRA